MDREDDTGIFAPRWNVRHLLIWTGAAFVLAGSWFWPETRALWDAFDLAIFRALNATVAASDAIAFFWALTGDRRFDYFSALIVLIIYLVVISRGDLARFRFGVAFGGVVSILLLVIIALQRELIEYPRPSPTLVLDATHSIRDFIPWSRAKEASATSFPGDHATVMMILALTWGLGLGRRLGTLAAVLTIVFALPRMAAGAHWTTDALIGGGFVTLLTAALLLGTPLVHYLQRGVRLASDPAVDFWLLAVSRLGREGRDNPNPAKQFMRGICIGAIQLVPGASAGSMALVLGLYRRLIEAVAHLDTEFIRLLGRGEFTAALRRADLVFVLPLLGGGIAAVIFFSRVVPIELLAAEIPEITFGLFFGLLAAAVVALLRRNGLPHGIAWLWLGAGVACGLAMGLLTPVDTPNEIWFVFLCGVFTVAAAMMPGLSAALILLILGKYATTLEAIANVDFLYLAPFAAGALVGVVSLSRLIASLLRRHAQTVTIAVTGLMGGSLLAVWPFQHREYMEVGGKMRLVVSEAYLPQTFDTGVVMSLAAMIAGAALYRLLDRLTKIEPAIEPERERTLA
ncbi:DUF368 domain-containing protein [Parvibaculum sp.]|uniref:undecaprenyl phosphate translocase family protein n=1 Tax=Parvibaculum sp. TaxID=2024848 RepID=UPI001DC2857F|nr:DUF368 domain-containing protein [Parvibaculum sp.]MBX3488760.1 DUF368 domain-containing protein [Parvibaculum sp.]MCW5727358.1 DUF368 domain-containing protein [Parvibaculum sp.]